MLTHVKKRRQYKPPSFEVLYLFAPKFVPFMIAFPNQHLKQCSNQPSRTSCRRRIKSPIHYAPGANTINIRFQYSIFFSVGTSFSLHEQIYSSAASKISSWAFSLESSTFVPCWRSLTIISRCQLDQKIIRVCISYTHLYPNKSLNHILPSRKYKMCFWANMQVASTLWSGIKSQKNIRASIQAQMNQV